MKNELLKNQRGQGIAVEYAIIFFIVIAAITAMSTYINRTIQARVRGARNYMWFQVQGVYGNLYANRKAPVEYEPYYINTRSAKNEDTTTITTDTPWAGHEGKFKTDVSSSVETQMISNVASPSQAN